MILIDERDPTPTFEQVRSQLADQIRMGLLPGGIRLPSVRQLAGDLGLAPGTVARAYATLESEGLVESSRATGTRVREDQAVPNATRVAARRFVRALREQAVSVDDAISAVRAEWAAGA